MKPIYQIREFGAFVCEKQIDGYVSLPEHTFLALEEFVLSSASEFMNLSVRKGIGKIITAKNYVGVITMKDGTAIEILPKIYSEIDSDEQGLHTKKLLIDMLKTLYDIPYKSLQTNHLNVEKMNIFEIFIRMFIDEVFFIVKRGLKYNYESIEENVPFFKGKIKFSQQIKYNHIHKEYHFVEYDAFTMNRPENRILKAALLYLYEKSSSPKNRNDIKILLNFFGELKPSINYKEDFSKYIPNRNMKDYTTALLWSKIFLMGNSFTSFSGSNLAIALLFPMETLFERYIASLFQKEFRNKDYIVSLQDRSYYLFEQANKKFLLKPDIVITSKTDNSIFIIDTKWKLLSSEKSNYGISQADMYQMYAYQKKYSAVHITLLYPKTDKIAADEKIEFVSNDGAVVRVRFVDLFDVGNLMNCFWE